MIGLLLDLTIYLWLSCRRILRVLSMSLSKKSSRLSRRSSSNRSSIRYRKSSRKR